MLTESQLEITKVLHGLERPFASMTLTDFLGILQLFGTDEKNETGSIIYLIPRSVIYIATFCQTFVDGSFCFYYVLFKKFDKKKQCQCFGQFKSKQWLAHYYQIINYCTVFHQFFWNSDFPNSHVDEYPLKIIQSMLNDCSSWTIHCQYNFEYSMLDPR